MKLSELRPCDACKGPTAPTFYVLRSSVAIYAPHAVNATLGLARIFGGALGLAEVMSPDPEVVKIGSDHDKELETEIFLCSSCYTREHNLALLVEKRCNAKPAR